MFHNCSNFKLRFLTCLLCPLISYSPVVHWVSVNHIVELEIASGDLGQLWKLKWSSRLWIFKCLLLGPCVVCWYHPLGHIKYYPISKKSNKMSSNSVKCLLFPSLVSRCCFVRYSSRAQTHTTPQSRKKQKHVCLVWLACRAETWWQPHTNQAKSSGKTAIQVIFPEMILQSWHSQSWSCNEIYPEGIL